MWAPNKYLVSCAFTLSACEAKALHTLFGNRSQQLLLVLISVVARRSCSANANNVISPGHSYCESLARFGLKTLQSRRETLCLKLFQSILSDEGFSNLVPPRHKASYNLRYLRTFTLPRFRTDRYKRSFIPAISKYINL